MECITRTLTCLKATSLFAIKVSLEEDYIKRNEHSSRRVFYHTTYTDHEIQKMKEFEDYLISIKANLPHWWSKELSLKMLQTADWKNEECAK